MKDIWDLETHLNVASHEILWDTHGYSCKMILHLKKGASHYLQVSVQDDRHYFGERSTQYEAFSYQPLQAGMMIDPNLRSLLAQVLTAQSESHSV